MTRRRGMTRRLVAGLRQPVVLARGVVFAAAAIVGILFALSFTTLSSTIGQADSASSTANANLERIARLNGEVARGARAQASSNKRRVMDTARLAKRNERRGKQTIRALSGAPGALGAIGLTGLPGLKGELGLPGAAGERGPQGLPGVQGGTGAKGDPGVAGTGLMGDPGQDGQRGEKGDPPTAAEIAAAVADYCAARNECRGPPGETGPAGPAGPQGPPADPAPIVP